MLTLGPLKVCFRCRATKGNADLQLAYTDNSSRALWRTGPAGEMWHTRPSIADLYGFTHKFICLDILHLCHLGCYRDLVATGFKLLACNRAYYHGRNISKRLAQLTSDLKSWCKANNQTLSLKRITRQTLTWRSDKCPELNLKRGRYPSLSAFSVP